MASTRSKNTPGNYCLEERDYKEARSYLLYPNSQYGTAYHTQLPGTGLLPGQIPGNQLSHNTADIESFLFGINTTNLVNPAPKLVAELKSLESVNIFKKEATFIPEPLIIEKNQRPFLFLN
jgi:hypothetical protein